MRASPVMFAVGVTVTAVAAGATSTPASPTSLRITYWEDSAKPAESVTWTLSCDPARGSVAQPVRACRKLAAGSVRLFAPTPKSAVCTEIYGGPQRARVVGTVNGKRIWATFTRSNGCEISRWQRISPWLVPPGGVT